jgi:ABC-type polysaccharide/polyol phosphate export permease
MKYDFKMHSVFHTHLAKLRFALRLSRYELRAKYSDSVLGYFWHLLPPILLFSIIYFVRSRLSPGPGTIDYPSFLLAGIIVWNFFREATQEGCASLLNRSEVIRHFFVKTSMLTFATTLTYLYVFLSYIFISILLLTATGKITLSVYWLGLIPVVTELFLVCLSINFVMAPLCIHLRDLYFGWVSLLPVLMCATPVFYSPTIFSGNARWIFLLNPLARLMEDFRRVLIDHSLPDAAIRPGFAGAVLLLFLLSLKLNALLSKRITERI